MQLLLVILINLGLTLALQSWSEQPAYQEVNPHGNLILPCIIRDMRGQCRWEKDGSPVGIYPGKYEWAGQPDGGDCSLSVLDAQLQYDDGVWQCQATPSSFQIRDALISEGAQLVVRESPTSIVIGKTGDGDGNVTASAGEDVELQCVVAGGNPPAKLTWFAQGKEITAGHTQTNARSSSAADSRTWVSTSKLMLPVGRADNGNQVRCVAAHPTLAKPLESVVSLAIHYPPIVSIETSSLEYLEEEKDPVTLRCISDSNPPAKVLWRKEGLNGIFSPDPEIHFSPVTRHTAGTYSCTAENALGTSQPAHIQLDIKFAPSIMSVGPSKIVSAQMNKKTTLTCEAESNPPPRYQWLQKLPTQEVLVRGYEKHLVIENVTYEHQGEFVCKAINSLRGELRSVQSEPIRVEVSGAPQVMKYSAKREVRVQNGEDATLEVLFCADPLPKQAWHFGDVNSGAGNNIILAAGTGHGRFVAESVRKADREDCYVSSLRINGAHADDSHGYELKLTNDHGIDSHTIHLVVKDYVSQESLIAVIVGSILTLLLIVLVVIYCCKSDRCCRIGSDAGKLHVKPTDLESERTDVESTHSSGMSGYPANEKAAAIPPDALYAAAAAASSGLYATSDKQRQYIHDAVFNDSKESLRPDLPHLSNLNRTNSSSGDLNTSQRISYNDLCFPKTSNYGSMKKKKHSHVGVDCRLGYSGVPQPMPSEPAGRTYY